MFGDIMGNTEKMQGEIRQKLKARSVEIKYEGISISGNASGEVLNIHIADELINANGKEQLEDFLVESFNRFIAGTKQAEAEISAQMLKEILPPGFENLFK